MPASVVPLRQAPQQGGFVFRVRYNDHVGFTRLLAERRLLAHGLIFDARHHERHEALRLDAARESVATWLDPQAMEMALPGGLSTARAALPWGALATQHASEVTPAVVTDCARKLAEFVIAGDYGAVFAPTHFLTEAGSRWLEVDAELASTLREALDARGGRHVQVIYPVATGSRLLQDEEMRHELQESLHDLPIDRVSLRIHPFGHDAGPLALRRFIEAAHDFRETSQFLLVERAGFAGLAAFALGAVNGIESGVTMGDSFDATELLKPSAKKRPFAPPKRVYLEALGASVHLSVARQLLESPQGKLWFACKDRQCCHDGARSMQSDPFRHSALARQRLYSDLSQAPASLRADLFINTTLARVADMLSRAGKIDRSFLKAHHRMLSVKETLAKIHDEQSRSRRRPSRTTSSDSRTATIVPLTPREPRGR